MHAVLKMSASNTKDALLGWLGFELTLPTMVDRQVILKLSIGF